MPQSSTQFSSRLVLENVPKGNFYEGGPRCPEDLCLASVFRALGEFFQEDAFGCQVNCSYSFFMGITGIAAACYAAEHDLMWKVWDLAGGNGNPEAFRLFADPAVRRRMIPVIQQAKEKDEQADLHIERALALGK